ncbi:nuclear transport factor 2 family protein [Streptomyces sp. GbtcB6]|uniref:nuclear transport factor 2 family protein n=1 Tax=Streptomyces sp. GbtcB6 TaxID=2824751 RepID=UPI001C309AFB|nr:nuclear transport factor 2 family protein [Streptomyces sp. GbtcB6]
MSNEADKQVVLAAIDDTTGRKNQVHRVLAQGDFVVTHATTTFPDGGQAAAFDLWRITDGRITGHWGGQEPIVERTANGHTQVDGATVIDTTADTDATRRVVEETVRTILVDNDFSDLDRYLAGESYTQHNPRFADGVSGLAAAMGELAKSGQSLKYSDVLDVVAEGNFAYVRSVGVFAGADLVFHDLFRVADGRAVEHWDVIAPR